MHMYHLHCRQVTKGSACTVQPNQVAFLFLIRVLDCTQLTFGIILGVGVGVVGVKAGAAAAVAGGSHLPPMYLPPSRRRPGTVSAVAAMGCLTAISFRPRIPPRRPGRPPSRLPLSITATAPHSIVDNSPMMTINIIAHFVVGVRKMAGKPSSQTGNPCQALRSCPMRSMILLYYHDDDKDVGHTHYLEM